MLSCEGLSYIAEHGSPVAVGNDRAVWKELNNISLWVLNIPTSGIRAEVREEGIMQLGRGHYKKNKDCVLESRGVSRDSERIIKHGLSSEITQSPGGSSNTSEGSKTSGSFEDYGRSGEGLML
ncbi:hypothetical protein Tco_0163001 [Tanacetum coccineum]